MGSGIISGCETFDKVFHQHREKKPRHDRLRVRFVHEKNFIEQISPIQSGEVRVKNFIKKSIVYLSSFDSLADIDVIIYNNDSLSLVKKVRL